MRRVVSNLVVFAGVAVGFGALLWAAAWMARPELGEREFPYSKEEIAQTIEARKAGFDPEHLPTLHVKEIVHARGESPIFAGLVAEGRLPPLRERVPDEPIVMTGKDGVGKYGGTWLRLAGNVPDIETINYRLSGCFLARWSPLGYPIEPHLAKSIAASEDKRVWTVTLRKGIRWSDGEPFTADDIMYWWNEEATNPYLYGAPPGFMLVAGKPGRVEKLDEYTVRFSFEKAHAIFLEYLASLRDFVDCPAHYLRQYNPDPKIGDQELIKREMAQYRMPSAAALYRFMKLPMNPDHPRLWPWIYKKYRSTTPQVFVRNPYYCVVDTAGNQLPYIDRIQFELQDSKMAGITAANGGVTMQDRLMRFSDYTELMSRRDMAGTRILHWYPASRSAYVINPNLNRRVDPAEPATKWKAQLLADKRFRQALSLAINRQQIIRADFAGVGEPSQVAPGKESPFYHEKVAKAFTEYAPDRAKKMLDQVGLTRWDREGFRTFADGSRMTFYLDFTNFTGIGPGQFVVDDWARIGVRAVLRERNRPLFYAEKDGLDFDFNVWTGESDFAPMVYPRYFIANNGESFYAAGWGRWFMRGGMYGSKDSLTGNPVPVPRDHPMYEGMKLYEEALHSAKFEDRKRLMDRVMDIAAENTWSISIATAPPQLVVVDQNLRNVPDNALYGVLFCTPANAGIETYYFDQPRISAGAVAEVRDSLLNPVPRPGKVVAATSVAGRLIGWLVAGAVVLALVMLIVQHPFVGRRLLIMVPTMLAISVIVFVIVRLPPGDFLTAKIIQFQASGDPSDLTQIEDLRRQFHFDEPAWKQYLRWMGLRWFLTFEPADTGLLQGNLGKSMETTTPINEMVGDRIVLTILMSLGTIFFTWMVAIPIGIYSAVKQYSATDHVLTLVGFIGMCVPAFLLALVLTAMSGVSGLFSPEFAAQPEWNWAKVWDLAKHMWIPIVVLGVGGTAGMIRVMRANLLDELKKPYVITAMAKGVRPTRLLLKYPVRMALNPFISGVGALFPQLVSGGAIVSMVLALPTVGPLLLSALFTEDMYLAASMLVVLSLLGIVGTLVSDLLLLWLDPRIRFEGGSR